MEGLYKLRIRESEKLKTVLELYNIQIHQKKAGPDYHRLQTMVKRSLEQNLRIKNFEARNGNYERNAVVKNQGTKQCEQRSLGDCGQWKANGQWSNGDKCSFRHDMNKRAKSTQPNPAPRNSTQQNVKNASRTRSPRGRSPGGRMSSLPCKDYLKGTCTNPFCEKWHPPVCLFYKSENGCRFGEKCSYAHRKVEEQPSKRSNKNGDKSAVAMLKRNEQHQRTGRPVLDAYYHVHTIGLRISGYGAAEFVSPFGKLVPACAIKKQPEEREIVVDSGASMDIISKKNLNSAQMDTLTKSCSPTIVITANGEVQTHEEASVYVEELDIFLTMKVLENTPAVLSLGKLCDEHGYSYEWINGQKPHLIKNGMSDTMQHGELRSDRGSWFVNEFFLSSHHSTSMTPSRQEIGHPTSSSSSSTSPPMTSSKEADHSDHPPAIVSSESVDRQVRRDPCHSEILEWLQEFRENLVDERVPEHRDSLASSSHGSSLEPTFKRREDLGCSYSHSQRPKLQDLPEDQNHKGPVQKTHWRSRTSGRKFW